VLLRGALFNRGLCIAVPQELAVFSVNACGWHSGELCDLVRTRPLKNYAAAKAVRDSPHFVRCVVLGSASGVV